MRLGSPLAAEIRFHADSPPRSAAGRPHRRRRSGRAAGCGGQGADRERARRRRAAHRRRDRSGRARVDPRRRRRRSAWTPTISRFRSSATRPRRFPTATSPTSPRSASAARRCRRSPRCRGSKSAAARAAPTRRSRSRSRTAAKSALRPISHPVGTRVEARDLFAATPARLKFLKSDRSRGASLEPTSCAASRSPAPACASPSSATSAARSTGRPARRGEAGERERLRQALGDAFVADALRVEAAREGVRISGWVGLPTFNKPNALTQYFFVNRRAARDRLLSGALARRRARLHPARPPLRRGAVRRLRAERGRRQRPSRQSRSALPRQRAHARAADRRGAPGLHGGGTSRQRQRRRRHARGDARARISRSPARRLVPGLDPGMARFARRAVGGREPLRRAGAGRLRRIRPVGRRARRRGAAPAADLAAPLGAARAQVHDTFIVSQTLDGVVIVDQHAAHERIVYEKLKRQRAQNGIARQILLSPAGRRPRAARRRRARRAGRPSSRRWAWSSKPFGPGAVAVARSAGAARRRRHGRAGARSRRRPRRRGRRARRSSASSTIGWRRSPAIIRCAPGRHAQARGDERAAARDGGDARRRPVQPRPPDLRRTEARRHRAAVRADGRGGGGRSVLSADFRARRPDVMSASRIARLRLATFELLPRGSGCSVSMTLR